MRKLIILGACISATAVAPVQASADCPAPTEVQGVESNGGTYSVSAQVQVKPVLWVANAGEDTVSKIGTDVNKEVARYSSGFWKGGIGGNGAVLPMHDAWTGPAPSRSAVDTDGNAYIANRGFSNRVAEVMKILTTGCIDRNNNGTCETSSDLNNDGKITTNEMYPVLDDNGNGIIEDSEIRDERVVWIKRIGAVNEVARALAIDKNGDLWVGMFNTKRFYRMSASTGANLGNVYVGVSPYGAAVDSKGRLFSAGLGSGYQVRFDTNNPNIQSSYYVQYGYGMAIGKDHTGVEKVIFAHHNTYGAGVMNPDTLATAYPLAGKNLTSYGISFDKNGDIMLSAGVGTGTQGASKSRTDGSVTWSRPPQAGCANGGQRGAIVDANNDVWIVNVDAHRVCKFLSDGTPSAQVPVGRFPYTYSDASGIGLQFSDPTGKVTFLADAVGADFNWAGQPVCFNGGGNVTLAMSAANSVTGLQFANPVAVPLTQQGTQLCVTVPAGVVGQHLQMTFSIKTGGTLTTTTTTGECTIDLPEGNAPPVAACKDVAVCANDQCVAMADVNNGSSDPDGDTLSMSFSPNGPYGLGQTLVSLAVNDGQATATCQATVTVNDCTAPAITCPAPVVAECTGNSSASAAAGFASASDNCGSANVSEVGSASYALGTTAISFSATDAAGNSNSCSSSVTVVDTTAPAITCPAAFTAECTGNGSADVTPGSAWSADVCGAVTVTNPGTASFSLGTTTVGYSAVDAQGLSATCSADIAVVDTTAPAITCPATISAECTGNNSATVTPASASASDICGSVSIANPGAASFAVGSTTLSYTATDAQGLTATCSAAVQVVDTTAPTVSSTGAGDMWPPNHKYKTISLADCGIKVADVCNGSMSLATSFAEITCVTSDEVEDANGNGDGNTLNDIVIVDGTTVTLRAEREGTGDGRLYKIGFRVKDASGNFTDGVCTTGTPHDQSGRGSVIIDSGVKYTVCK